MPSRNSTATPRGRSRSTCPTLPAAGRHRIDVGETNWVHHAGGGYDLGADDALDVGELRRIDVDERTFVLCRLSDDEYVVGDGLCTHHKVHLAGGAIVEGQIECPKHNGRFDARTGEVTRKPPREALCMYPVAASVGVSSASSNPHPPPSSTRCTHELLRLRSIDAIRYAGPDSDDPLDVPLVRRRPGGARPSMRDQLRFAVCYWHSFSWNGFDIFGDGTLDRPWTRSRPRPDRGRRAEDGRRVRVHVEADRAVLVLPRPGHRARGRHVRRVGRNLDHMVDLAAEHQAADRRRAVVGHRQPVRQPALPGRRRHQPRPRGVRLRRRAGRPLLGRDAPPRWPQLRAVGRPRGLRDAAQHRHEARARPARPVPEPGRRAQARDRVRGHDPHRAEAVRADQAPVRLRRRRRVRASCSATASSTRSRSTSRSTTPRWPGTTSPTRSPRRSTPGSSGRSTPTPATTGSAGTSTASRCRSSR